MAITGDHLIELGRELEHEKVEKAENERDAAKQECDIAKRERDATTKKLKEAFDTIDSLKKPLHV